MSEHQEQAAYFQWLALQKIEGTGTAFAVPNGGERNVVVAAKLKAEGVKPGVPDVLLPTPRGGFVGLAIEFKAGDGNPTREQRLRITDLQEDGWCVVLCWNWRAALRITRGYLGMLKLEMA